MDFSSQELLQYSRHLTLPNVGLVGQTKLKNASLLCVGAGGLGCPLLQYLAASGVGRIGIIDGDSVDVTNLHRQILYNNDDIGRKKVDVCKEKLTSLNSNIQIDTYDEMLDANKAKEYFSCYDIIADCTDNYETRYLINDACKELKKPYVFASIYQFEGVCTFFPGEKSPCYRCLYEEPPPPELIPNCAEAGVIGVLPGLLGVIQAVEVIKYILGIGEVLTGKLLKVDALSLQFQQFEIKQHPNCAICVHHQSFEKLNRNFIGCQISSDSEILQLTPQAVKELKDNNAIFLLDVRDEYEYAICNINGYLIPFKELEQRCAEIDKQKKIVVHCKSGGRSQQAIKLLQKLGFNNLYNLQGGILAWRREIDPTLPKY